MYDKVTKQPWVLFFFLLRLSFFPADLDPFTDYLGGRSLGSTDASDFCDFSICTIRPAIVPRRLAAASAGRSVDKQPSRHCFFLFSGIFEPTGVSHAGDIASVLSRRANTRIFLPGIFLSPSSIRCTAIQPLSLRRGAGSHSLTWLFFLASGRVSQDEVHLADRRMTDLTPPFSPRRGSFPLFFFAHR